MEVKVWSECHVQKPCQLLLQCWPARYGGGSMSSPENTQQSCHPTTRYVMTPNQSCSCTAFGFFQFLSFSLVLIVIRDNILRVRGLETAPDTIKMAEIIIVMPCCDGKSRQPNSTIPFRYVQTKLQSFSNWGNHNRKLESVCPRYKMPEKHNGYATGLPLFTPKWPLEKPIPQLQSSFE